MGGKELHRCWADLPSPEPWRQREAELDRLKFLKDSLLSWLSAGPQRCTVKTKPFLTPSGARICAWQILLRMHYALKPQWSENTASTLPPTPIKWLRLHDNHHHKRASVFPGFVCWLPSIVSRSPWSKWSINNYLYICLVDWHACREKPESGHCIGNSAAEYHVACDCLFTFPFLQWVVILLTGAMWRRREGIQEEEGGNEVQLIWRHTAGRMYDVEKWWRQRKNWPPVMEIRWSICKELLLFLPRSTLEFIKSSNRLYSLAHSLVFG